MMPLKQPKPLKLGICYSSTTIFEAFQTKYIPSMNKSINEIKINEH